MDTARIQQAVKFLRAHPITHLATAAENVPTVRVMSVATVEGDGTIWYASYTTSEKVRQIQQQPQVAISAYEDGTTLELTGRAEIIDDAEQKRKLWSDSWMTYFPNGKEDPEYVLIKITPEAITVY
jgi:general stress protein 26